jgi:prepilin-type N-terminal cleavage/methylation domain-containing protein
VQRGRSGITLIEMIIVLSVMGIMVGMGLPRFHGMIERAGVSSARDQVMSALQVARTTAVRRAANTTFNISGDEIWVTSDSSGTSVTIMPKMSMYTQHSAKVTTSGKVDAIQFNMRGLASGVAGRIFLTRGSKVDSVCVTVLGGTTRLACPS